MVSIQDENAAIAPSGNNESSGTSTGLHNPVLRRPNAKKLAASRLKNERSSFQNTSDSDNYNPKVLLAALQAMRDGDFSVRLPGSWIGLEGKIADTFNEIVSTNEQVASELERVGQAVGQEGKTRQRFRCDRRQGAWGAMEASVNTLMDDLLWPTTEVTRSVAAVAKGDLSQTVPLEIEGRELQGEFLRSAKIVNKMIDQMNVFTSEVTRVAREVGAEGKLGGQAKVRGVSGVWKDLTDNVNSMANNLTAQVRNISEVTIAVADGDLSRKITVDVRGEILQLKEAINTMVDQLRSFASEVTRVAREVGTEGKLGGQAIVPGVAGTWKDLTDNVNVMAANLTDQVRGIAEVATAIARGDLSRKITVDVKGEILELKNTINIMVDQLNGFAAEVTRVAREVGTEGKLGGQAEVPGVAGTWKNLTDNVNSMAGNLTAQVRNIAEVATAVARGDLSRKVTVDVKGEISELKNTINTMVDQLNGFASEVTRVAREVGTEGELGGQAIVPGVAGTWKDLTDSVNAMATNLTAQVRNIAEVTTAVARGDLSRKITVDVKGEILRLKDTINTMVDQLNGFAAEVTRVAREVGTEGKLGGQAEVPGVAGTWKNLTDNVNSMAGNLTGQVRNIAEVTTAVARGDLSRKITVDVKGEILQLKDTINTMVDQLNSFASEVTRVSREVGTEGKLGGQARVPGVAGTWKDLTDNVNVMATNLTDQVRGIAEVATAIAGGDLSRKITVDVRGEILQLKDTINTMVDQLNSFASEVTRVAREVGTEGKLGGQAKVPGVAGTWKDLTDNVNVMAHNLTDQVRGIVKVVTAVANGDLTQKLTVESKGEVAALAETINSMTDTLATFADQVTTVAHEVGVEGRLGGQANVPGAAGTWKDLTANVNLLAANLTTQVRAIAEVATAVTTGDLTRYIQVDASGEVADLKNYINAMIGNLRKTTDRNTEQDWLKTNLAKFSRMMQGQRDLTAVAQMLLSELAPLVNAQQGVIYAMAEVDGDVRLRQLAGYADKFDKSQAEREFKVGEGLVGQCVVERHRLIITETDQQPLRITSGLVEVAPRMVMVLPVLFEGDVKAVIELASLKEFNASHTAFLEQLADIVGIVLNNIEATMRTERLLAQSQQLATELQTRQSELQQTNEELAQKAQLLAVQNAEVERKNREIDHARRAVEEKAAELALTSRYKSEFLANVSHELRTPLHSILILGEQLAENADRNLTPRQVEFANTIHAAGTDLLNLISDILDLSKIESGTVTVESEKLPFANLREIVERNFRHQADTRRLVFFTELSRNLDEFIYTDPKRLLQVLKNLLSNAFKFTEQGSVRLSVEVAQKGWTPGHPVLDQAATVVSFSVTDTGVGIPVDKQKLIFEAFQQADAGTARRYGGTGLGLAISRELAQLLGGEITLESTPGKGSTFTLYLPLNYGNPASRYLPSLPTRSAKDGNHQPVLLAATRLEEVPDDRNNIGPDDKVVMIVEDDPRYAHILLDQAHTHGFKGLVAMRGDDAMGLVNNYALAAVSLDIFLPDMLGWTILSHLKQYPDTRHIPVQIVTVEEERQHGLGRGAYAYLNKSGTSERIGEAFANLRDFVEPRRRKLLIVEDEQPQTSGVVELLSHDDVDIVTTGRGSLGLEEMRNTPFDCVVLDLGLSDTSGFEFLGEIQKSTRLRNIPVVTFSSKELTEEEEEYLRVLGKTMVLKHARSQERLLDNATLFLHCNITKMSETQQRMLEKLYESEDILFGQKVLIVDDDVRNIFALSSILERHHMQVLTANNGRDAIDILERTDDLALVLMDIMMPEMDGYETMRQIRAQPKFNLLPIIALTAKAMKGDREKCLEAGASEYVAKPVNNQQLVALFRTWLHR
jgi:HAMP domain-containing protein/signal transduction histidine kinase/DNA-binding response OmpR family regulator